ncbi:ADP-ribosylation factor-binding protein GGA3 isoform X4 [Dama dama]|uniref:ADP-ribosylation factor-binding protein GGA3 isoform X4 n=1 Tax=Dama dama TaxID=30532 RepID=UPI002A369D96|nr:ADP-ribosylation factor-binding protein GGA3 isoform X4 [Dama dama]
MAEAEGESLESWLNKATNPSNRQEDWEYIIGFCDQINKELEGPQIAVRLLAHKIQSPQEWEAVQALTVLEACMKNCGRRLHNEVGKFRFLNELIKVVSPKYLGDRVSEKVKTKVIELLYSWTLALPEESKIKDAYHMLKRQGIVHSDPLISVDRTLIPSPPPRPKNPVFDDEEKSKLLAKLLKSKNPDDLQEANKLIKSMVKEDEARVQKVTERLHTLEEVDNSVKLLGEMLRHYSREGSAEADKELMKELFDRCENKRRTLFKLASETEDNDNSLGDILQASDNLSRVINSYKIVVEGQVINGEVVTSEGNSHSSHQGTLIDLAEVDAPSSPPPALAPAPASSSIPVLPPPPQASGPGRSHSAGQPEAPPGPSSTSNALSLLDEELLCLGLADPVPSAPPAEAAGNSQWSLLQSEQSDLDFFSSKPGPGVCSPTDGPLLQPSVAPAGSPQALVVPVGVPAPKAGPFLFSTGLAPAPAPDAKPITPGCHGSALGDSTLHQLDVLDQLLQEAKVVASSFAWPSTRLVLLPAAQDIRPGETHHLQLLPRRCRPSSAPHRCLRSASTPPLHGALQPSLPGPGQPREGARALPGQCPRAPGIYQA